MGLEYCEACGKKNRGCLKTVCETIRIPPPQGSTSAPLAAEKCTDKCVLRPPVGVMPFPVTSTSRYVVRGSVLYIAERTEK